MSFEKGEHNYDVVIVGAGISGTNFAYRLQERNPELSFTVLESRSELGGTWSLFKYPGIRSDSDLYTFGYGFRPWQSTSSIAEGPFILEYMKETAAMYGIDKKIEFNHSVNTAAWSSKTNSWTLDVSHGEEKKTYRSRWLLFCTGYYNYGKPLPSPIKGIDSFQGQVIHPQFWPEDLDYADKNIVIVGSGATSVTLLPSLAQKASKVTMLQRSPSYVVSQPSEDAMERGIRRVFSKPWQHTLIRWKWIFFPWLFVRICLNMPKFARKMILKGTERQLPKGMAVDPNFTPKYDPFQQRVCLCPNADFYKALRSGKATVKTAVIDTVTEDAIRLTTGEELKPDIIVTATGLQLSFCGGIKLTVDGAAVDPATKLVWKGALLEDLPNCAFSMGYVDASWTLGADATAALVCRILKRMRADGTVAVVPRCSPAEHDQIEERPLIRLNSTYVERARSVTPKCGDRGQWVPRNYYYKDILGAWFGNITKNLEWVRAS